MFKLAKKWKLDVSDLKNKWSIKMNIERSRREYLQLKAQHVALRKKYLKKQEEILNGKKKSKRDSLSGVIALLENKR